ncbi:MAG TPA: glycosyltransferase [Bacteroidia bacterium]|jgi:colanic acid/amylovoran biosynthesis glycosyltransferase|nr:glycosyltransferase [Bacteroidia bacterium]
MRILVFVESFMYPTLSFIYNEVKGLAEKHEVLLVTTHRRFAEDYPFPNVVVIPYKVNRLKKKWRWELEKRDISIKRSDAPFAEGLNKLVDSFKPDLIQGHFGYESLILLENLNPVQVPVFITFHGYDASQMLNKQAYIERLNSLFANFDTHTIVASDYMKLDLEKAGVQLHNCAINYYGIDCRRLKRPEQNPPDHPFVFLQIASFTEKKGHIYTLRAFRKFLDTKADKTQFKLVLAGGWDLLEETKQQAADLNLMDYVDFPGVVSHDQAYEHLCKAHAFLHHSIVSSKGDKEGIPNALMEAMALELPVITTWHSGIPELVEDGLNGFLIEEKDVDTYAEKMEEILSWGLIPENREVILKTFSLDVHMNKLLNLYASATATGEKTKA